MRALFSSSMAALLIIHAMIGCCHCHRHGDAATAAAATIAVCPCCDHGCELPEQGEELPDPCTGEGECHGVCSYLPTPKTEIAAACVGFDLVAVAPTQGTFCRTLTSPRCDRAYTIGDSPPPLRLHLMHQILLI